jgi:WD40 repeat protein
MRTVFILCLCLILQLSLTDQQARAQQLDLVVQTGNAETLSNVSFSHDGKLLATAGYEHTIKLWDVATGLQIKEFRPQEPIYFQPSNFSRYTYAESRVINGKPTFVEYTLVNELFLAETSLSKYLYEQLGPRTRELLRKQHDHPSPGLLRALADDLNRTLKSEGLYSAERFKGVELSPEVMALLDKKPTGESRLRLNRLLMEQAYPRQLGQAHGGGYDEVVFSHDGKLLAARTFNEEIQLWAVGTGGEISILESASGQMAFSPDDRALAVIDGFDQVALYDATSGVLNKRLQTRFDDLHEFARPEAIFFSPVGKTLLVIEQYQHRRPREEGEREEVGFLLRHWNAESASETPNSLRQVKVGTYGNDDKIQAQCTSPDGRAVVYEVASKVKDDLGNERITYRDILLRLDTGRDKKIDEGFRPADELWATDNKKVGCGFSSDGRALAVAKGNTLRIFSGETGEQTKDYLLDFKTDHLSFGSDNSKLALAGGNEVSLFDLRSGKLSGTMASRVSSVNGRFSRDGKRLMLSRDGDDDQVFDLADGKEAPGPGDLRANIETIFTSKTWDVSTGRCVTTQEHAVELPEYIPRFVSKKRISPDGKLGASPEMDRVQSR